ncbi:MAG: CBS domain-containing protein [Euryarchaeota archaeon]|nr:CBS domain-containing protein [Euryarchaeota archaeon]
MIEAKIGTNIKDIMTKDVVTVKEDDTIQDLLKLFKKYHYHSYPVVTSEGELVGGSTRISFWSVS